MHTRARIKPWRVRRENRAGPGVGTWRPGTKKAGVAVTPRRLPVPRRGFEPPRFDPLDPESSASTSSATWATGRGSIAGPRGCQPARRGGGPGPGRLFGSRAGRESSPAFSGPTMTTAAAALLLALVASAEPSGAPSAATGAAEGASDSGRFGSLLGAESLQGGSAAHLGRLRLPRRGLRPGGHHPGRHRRHPRLRLERHRTVLSASAPPPREHRLLADGRPALGRLVPELRRHLDPLRQPGRPRHPAGAGAAPLHPRRGRPGLGLGRAAAHLHDLARRRLPPRPEGLGRLRDALYDALTLGLRGALSWRGGGGSAPMRGGRVEPELLVVLGYRVF